MFSALAVMAHKVGDRAYHFMCDPNSPVDEIKAALWQFGANIAKIEEQALERAAKAKIDAEEPPEKTSDAESSVEK